LELELIFKENVKSLL